MRHFRPNFKIDYIKLSNTELTKDRLYIKNKMVDILISSNNEIINIEINNNNFPEFIKNRNFLYLCSMVVESKETSSSYIDIKEHIQINFNFEGKNNYDFKEYKYMSKDGDILFKYMTTININVDYFIDQWYNSNNQEYYEKYKDIIILGMNRQEILNIKGDKYMEKISKDVEKLNRSKDFYQLFTDEEDREMIRLSEIEMARKEGTELGIREGTEIGIKQGIEQGKKKNKIEIAKKMKDENFKIEDIAKITGLSIEEIKKI